MRASRARRLGTCAIAAIVGCSTVVVGTAAGAGAACAGAWVTPVDGRVVDPFRAPPNPYGPGNRGMDLAAAPGTPVHAAGAGVVAFAGTVAGSLHVVVEHPGGLRTTYAFLGSVAVRAGQPVARGQVVGGSGTGGPGQPANSVHFGLRLGDRYVDPAVLFRPCDLSKLVNLTVTDQPAREPWDALRAAGIATIRVESGGGGGVLDDLAGALGPVASVLGGAAKLADDSARLLVDTGSRLLESAAHYGSTLLAELAARAQAALRRSPGAAMASVLAEVGQRLVAWWQQRSDCSDDSPPADGSGGSTHLLMAVGGIDSAGGPHQPTFALDAEALGYHDDEVTYFSYAPEGGHYRPEDTRDDLVAAALLLDRQLRQSQLDNPGREVDLIAHSQGGVVVDLFLQALYRAGDPGLPPIGTVVTLSSPHEGAPLATAARQWRSTSLGGPLLDAASGHLPLPPADARSVQELAEHSKILRHLWDHGLPDHIDFTTIGGTDDLVVPATQIDVPGATEVVVNVDGNPLEDHTNIADDPRALQVVRAALEGRPPPCTGLSDGLRGAVAPVLISRFEHGLGALSGLVP